MSTQPQAIIRCVGLTKVFRDFWRRARVRAVSDVDFEVRSGEVFGLLGPNGSGKSTTIKMILGLLHPTRGRVSIFGRPPEDVRIKSRIGYLPEESYLYRFLNARETLDYYGTLFRLPRRDRRRRTDELLEMVGLRSAARRPVGEYSKGMARRIGLAQALVNDPDLLILDEPTSGLDPIGTRLVKDIILRLSRNYHKTILLSSHLLADVEEVCDRVTILYGGRVREAGSLDDVLSQRDRHELLVDRLSDETLQAVAQLIRQREGKEVEVSIPRDRLEALFLRIVQRAQTEKLETAGSAPAGDIAGFLGAGSDAAHGAALLDSLVHTEAVEAEPAVEVTAATAEADRAVLAELDATQPPPAAPAPPPAPAGPSVPPSTAATPVAPPPARTGGVDESVLDALVEHPDDESERRS